MFEVIPLFLAVLVSVGIIVIGYFYVVSPQRISGGFGLDEAANIFGEQCFFLMLGCAERALDPAECVAQDEVAR
jgi:hypothetical protein